MGRLIDAEKCPCKGCGVMYCYKNCKEYDEWFFGCAYDVEAVVAAIKSKHCKKCRNILGVAGAEEYCKEQKCEIEGVCEIVRNGGKE